MPSTQDFDFENLYGVNHERALNFWVSHLQDQMGDRRWEQIRDSTGVYIASVLGHFCLTSMDRLAILSPEYSCGESDFRQFADLTQIAEMMLQQLTAAKSPAWMESAGAHILLYAGFFQSQNKHRHNIDFFTAMGSDCYMMAAVGKREKTMRRMAEEFPEYLFHLANIQRSLQESRYLIRMN